MRELRIPGVEIPIYWTAWEFPDDAISGTVHRRAFRWVKAKPSRSASVWRLADVAKTRWFIVAVSEHARSWRRWRSGSSARPTTTQGEWYEIPEDEADRAGHAARAGRARRSAVGRRRVTSVESGTSRAAGG